MINLISFYVDLGTKSARARNQHDEARAKFHAEHFRKALGLESEEHKKLCSRLYDDAYRNERNVPTPEHFK